MKDIKMPKLTRGQVENLLDAPYDMVVAYDFATGKVNRAKYAGRTVAQNGLADYAPALKRDIENMVDFEGRKLIMAVVQGVPQVSWNGKNEFVQYPLNDEMSQLIVGNVVAFNPKTGLYEANPKGWMGLDIKGVMTYGQYVALQRFMFRMWAHERERQALIAPFKTK